jgi:hypothetical protein
VRPTVLELPSMSVAFPTAAPLSEIVPVFVRELPASSV